MTYYFRSYNFFSILIFFAAPDRPLDTLRVRIVYDKVVSETSDGFFPYLRNRIIRALSSRYIFSMKHRGVISFLLVVTYYIQADAKHSRFIFMKSKKTIEFIRNRSCSITRRVRAGHREETIPITRTAINNSAFRIHGSRVSVCVSIVL